MTPIQRYHTCTDAMDALTRGNTMKAEALLTILERDLKKQMGEAMDRAANGESTEFANKLRTTTN